MEPSPFDVLQELAQAVDKLETIRQVVRLQYINDLKVRMKPEDYVGVADPCHGIVSAAHKELGNTTDFYAVAKLILQIHSKSVSAHVADCSVKDFYASAKLILQIHSQSISTHVADSIVKA